MNISKYFQHRFTLSEDGAKTFIKGVIASLFLNLALMLPVIFIFLFITDYLHPVIQAGNSTTHGLWYYVLTALCFMTVLFVIAMIQYKSIPRVPTVVLALPRSCVNCLWLSSEKRIFRISPLR